MRRIVLSLDGSLPPNKKLFRKKNLAKKWLFWKRRKEQLFWRNSCSEKVTAVVILEKCEEVAFPKIKLPWKSGNICENGNRYLKKGNQIRLVITFNWNYFPEFAKLRALRAFAPSRLTHLRAFAPYVPWFLRALITCLAALFIICAPYSLAI